MASSSKDKKPQLLLTGNVTNILPFPTSPSNPTTPSFANATKVLDESLVNSATTISNTPLKSGTPNLSMVLVQHQANDKQLVTGSHFHNPGPIRLPNPVTFIEHGRLRFMILDAPTDTSLPIYLQEMIKHHVTDVVRVCNPTYSTRSLAANNIEVHDWPFDDGEAPPYEVVDNWLDLIYKRFPVPRKNVGSHVAIDDVSKKSTLSPDKPSHNGKTLGSRSEATVKTNSTNALNTDSAAKKSIAVHCVAGLGRAPVLVAIALIEDGMSALDSVAYIRDKRRGAINNKQLKFLEQYKRRRHGGKCVVM